MDSLDLLENFTGVFFSLLPLVGFSFRERFSEIIFAGTNYDLNAEQKFEILRRVDFALLLITTLVATQAVVLTVLAYHHASFFGVLFAIAVGYAGLVFVLWIWNLGATRFSGLSLLVQLLCTAAPFLLLTAKILVVYFSVGVNLQVPSVLKENSSSTATSPKAGWRG